MITYYRDLQQGSDEWLEARRGLLTASEMRFLVTPATLKTARNDKTRAHLWELLAQRVSGFVEPSYIGDDMLRGYEDEILARELYAEKVAPVQEMGFITNDKWGFRIGYSPDGLVGDDGLIECKSRRQRFQVETITTGIVPDEYLIQIQTGLMVCEREWCDFISYSAGLPAVIIRVHADAKAQDAIQIAAEDFEDRIAGALASYRQQIGGEAITFPTPRRVKMEIPL